MNESQLLGFCLKALIKNTISCLQIHIMKAMSPVHLIATVYCNMINHADENINPFFAIQLIHSQYIPGFLKTWLPEIGHILRPSRLKEYASHQQDFN